MLQSALMILRFVVTCNGCNSISHFSPIPVIYPGLLGSLVLSSKFINLLLPLRHRTFRLITLYKMIHNRTPAYLRSLLPPRQGQYANRPTRFKHNFCAPRTRGQKYHQSFMPRTVREWNILDEAQKQIPTTSSFKANLKTKLSQQKCSYALKVKVAVL